MSVITQYRSLGRVFFFLYLPIFLLFLAIGVWSRFNHQISLDFLVQDIATTGELPSFAGFVSQMENVLWSAALTVCFLGLIMIQRWTRDLAASKRFLLQAGIVTFALLFDDTFLFHGDIAPKYLGISENSVIAGYLVMGIVFVYANWREILSSEYIFLILALIMFGASIFLDALPAVSTEVNYLWNKVELLLEDGLKFAAIATWLTYYVRYVIHHIEAIHDSRRAALR